MSNILDLKEKTPDNQNLPEIKTNQENAVKPSIWIRFKNWLKTPKGKVRFILIVLAILILVAAGLVAYLRYFKKQILPWINSTSLPAINYNKEPEVKKVTSLLDGIMYPEDVSNRHPLGIMIENHPEARPQSGLDKTKTVYEAITEGGITRFLAIFGPEGASKVGPVRSARTYYLDWCLEYDCFYSHVGGNLDALQLIPKLGIKDLDQFRYGTEAYWREPEKGKATEHTMFTDTDKLWKISQKNSWDMKSDFTSWGYKTEAPLEQRPELASITIDFSSPGYKVKWTYDKVNNLYQREIAGIPHKDAVSGIQLTAKNVIVQDVQRWSAPTEINEEGWAMKTVGSGKAKVFMDGKMYEGTWKKADKNSRTVFYGTDGKELSLNPGNTWISIVPPDVSVIIQ